MGVKCTYSVCLKKNYIDASLINQILLNHMKPAYPFLCLFR